MLAFFIIIIFIIFFYSSHSKKTLDTYRHTFWNPGIPDPGPENLTGLSGRQQGTSEPNSRHGFK